MGSCIGVAVHRSACLRFLWATTQLSSECLLRHHCSCRRDWSQFWIFFGLVKPSVGDFELHFVSMDFPCYTICKIQYAIKSVKYIV